MLTPAGHLWLARACEALPLFPLPDLVLIPGTRLPLHVFEARYRALVAYTHEHDRIIGIPRLAPGWQSDYEGSPPVHPVCGIGRIVRHEPLSDGRSNLLLACVGRARLLSEHLSELGFRIAHARLLDDLPAAGPAMQRAATALRAQVFSLMRCSPRLAPGLSRIVEDHPDDADLASNLAHVLIRDPDRRQAWLELDDPVARAELVMAALVDRVSESA